MLFCVFLLLFVCFGIILILLVVVILTLMGVVMRKALWTTKNLIVWIHEDEKAKKEGSVIVSKQPFSAFIFSVKKEELKIMEK